MKKIMALLLAALLLFSMTACGTKTDTEETKEQGPVQVDEGLLTVEITLGANLFNDQTPEEIKADAEEQGYLECTIAEDGSVTYKMTKKQHKEKLAEFKKDLEEMVAGLLEGDDAVESFVSIDYNDDFSKIDIKVDPELYSSWDSLYVLTFYVSGAYYQSFAGVDGDKIDVIVSFIDNNTDEVLNVASYKTFIKNLAEESSTETTVAE